MTRAMNDETDDEVVGAAAAPAAGGYDPEEAIGGEDIPDWVKEGNRQQDYDVPDIGNISGAKPMESSPEWIPPAKGVLMVIKKIQVERNQPKDADVWKQMQFNVHLQVRDGITYARGEKPKYKGKMFFHRFYVAVNREAEQAGVFDFNISSKGKQTDYWSTPDGSAWGHLKEFLEALGFDSSAPPKMNKAWQDAQLGRVIAYDIDKVVREQFDKEKRESVKIRGEYQNQLSNAKAVKDGSASQTAAPAAVAATADAPDWDKAEV